MSEINVTPLIDLAFALLIIFMITAPLLQQTIDIQVPIESAKQQSTSPELEVVVLSIDADGQFYWDGEGLSDGDIRTRLEGVSNQEEQPVIQVQADANLPYQRVVDLLDLIQQNGLSKLKFETRSR